MTGKTFRIAAKFKHALLGALTPLSYRVTLLNLTCV